MNKNEFIQIVLKNKIKYFLPQKKTNWTYQNLVKLILINLMKF